MIIFIFINLVYSDYVENQNEIKSYDISDGRFNKFRIDLFYETLNNYQQLMIAHEELARKFNSLKNENERLSKSFLETSNKLNRCTNGIHECTEGYIQCTEQFVQCSNDFNDLSNGYDQIVNGTKINKCKNHVSNLKWYIYFCVIIMCILVGLIIIEICYCYHYINQNKQLKNEIEKLQKRKPKQK